MNIKKKIQKKRQNSDNKEVNSFMKRKLKNIEELKLKDCSEFIISIKFFFDKYKYKINKDFTHPFALLKNSKIEFNNMYFKSNLKTDFILFEPLLIEKNQSTFFNLETNKNESYVFAIKVFKLIDNEIDFSQGYLWILNNDFIIEVEKKNYNYKFSKFNYSLMNDQLNQLNLKDQTFKFFKQYFNYFLSIFSTKNIYNKSTLTDDLNDYVQGLIFLGNDVNIFMDYKLDKNGRIFCYVFHPNNNLYQWVYFDETKLIKILKSVKIKTKEVIINNLKYNDNIITKPNNSEEICYKCKYKINNLNKVKCNNCLIVVHDKCLNNNDYESEKLKLPCLCNEYCCFCEISYEKQGLIKCKLCHQMKMHSFCIQNKNINACINCYLCKFCNKLVNYETMEIFNQFLFCDKQCINEFINKENCICCNEKILNKKVNNIVCSLCNSNYNYQCLLKENKNIIKENVKYCIICSHKIKSDQILFLLKILKYLDRFDFFVNPLNENSTIYYSIVKNPIFISYMFEKNLYNYYNINSYEKLLNDINTLEKNIKIYNMPDTPAYLEGYMFIKWSKYFLNSYKILWNSTVYNIMISIDNKYLLQHNFYKIISEIYENLLNILFKENDYKIIFRNINIYNKNNQYYKYMNDLKLKDIEIFQIISEYKFLNNNKLINYDIIFNLKNFKLTNFDKNNKEIENIYNNEINLDGANDLIIFIMNLDNEENVMLNKLKLNLVDNFDDKKNCFNCCTQIYDDNYLECSNCNIFLHNNETNFLINNICIFCYSCDICNEKIGNNNSYVKCNICCNKLYHTECYYKNFNENILSINYKDFEIYLKKYLKNSLYCFDCFNCVNCKEVINLKINKNNCIDIFFTINILGRICLKCSSSFRKKNYCYLCYKIIIEKDEFTGNDLSEVIIKNYRINLCTICKFPMHLQCFIDNILNLLNIGDIGLVYEKLNYRLNNFKCNCNQIANDNLNKDIIIEKEIYENYLNKYELILKMLDNLIINKKLNSNKLISTKKLYTIFFMHNNFYTILKDNLKYEDFIQVTSYDDESIKKVQIFLNNIDFDNENNYKLFLENNFYKEKEYMKDLSKNYFFEDIIKFLKNSFDINLTLLKALKKYYSSFKLKVKELYKSLENDYLVEFNKLLDKKIKSNLECLAYEKTNINFNNNICNICKSNEENDLYGKIVYFSFKVYCHLNCLKWLDGVYTYNESNFKLIFNFENIVFENIKRICNSCNLENAQITCQICKIEKYHIKCAIGKCLFIFNQSYKVVCKGCLVQFITKNINKKIKGDTISKLWINNDQNILNDPFKDHLKYPCISFNYEKSNINKEQGIVLKNIGVYNSYNDIKLIKEEFNDKKFFIQIGNFYLIPYNFKTNEEEIKKEIVLFKNFKDLIKDKNILNKVLFPELKFCYINKETNDYNIIYLKKSISDQNILKNNSYSDVLKDLFVVETFKYNSILELENNLDKLNYSKIVSSDDQFISKIIKILKIDTIYEYINILVQQKIIYINKIIKNNFEINMNFDIFEPITYSLDEFQLMYNEKINTSVFDKTKFIKDKYNNYKFSKETPESFNNIEILNRKYNIQKVIKDKNVNENHEIFNLQINFLEYLKDPFKENILKYTSKSEEVKKNTNKILNIDFEFLQNRLGDFQINKQNYEFLKNSYLNNNNKQKGFVMNSKIHKYGYISNCFIKKHEFVTEYIGEIIREIQASHREMLYQKEGFGDCYMFSSDKTKIIDATYKGNEARYLNHSCDPNCASIKIKFKDLNRIILFAIKDIAKGEELTFDYNFQLEEEKLNCLCGAENCKGRLN